MSENSNMSEDNRPGVLSHVSLGTNNLPAAIAFYDSALAPLGITRLETIDGLAVAYGKSNPELWICVPLDEQPASAGNGMHIGLNADSTAAVHAFFDAALQAGARDNGAPGPRPHYGEQYYGCFVIDLDGNRIEAVFFR